MLRLPWTPRGSARSVASLAPKALALLVATLVVAGAARAQPPDADWRTLEIPDPRGGAGGFRVHFVGEPETSRAWARNAAARLQANRERLAAEVGFEPRGVIDVIIADPAGQPNGFAWPLLGAPRIVVWTAPPRPASLLGAYRDWGELVSTHEQAHLAHLLRPSRSPWRRAAARLLPLGGLGPIARRAPRWVIEGYATLLEGRLTGAGRPESDLVAAVLRRRALAGRLPAYGALGRGDRTWLGRSMAYLLGSEYLTWLEERDGPGSLGSVWTRLSARRSRSFDEAFRGVFGEGPAELYGRFTTEITWRAVEERRLHPDPVEGALWLKRSWRTGAPAVSPDGERLAVVLREGPDGGRPPRLVVYATAPDAEAEARRREAVERLLARDPEDLPAVPPEAAPRKVLATLPTIDGRAPAEPRWLPDGDSLLFTAAAPDGDGVLHLDLYRWWPTGGAGGRVERITRGADLRSPDPARPADGSAPPAAGSWAVAVRNGRGASRLVRVDLETGTVSALTEASAGTVWASPRLAPGGRRMAALRNRGEGWRMVLFDLGPGGRGLMAHERRELPLPGPVAGGGRERYRTLADPAWSPDGRTLYAAVGEDGFIDLVAVDATLEKAVPRRLTHTLGAALAPEPTPDGKALFFLSLEAHGLDVRRLDLPAATEAATGGDAATPERPHGAPPERPYDGPPDRPYSLGPRELVPLVGLALSPAGEAFEAGLAGSDPVGRLDWLLLAAAGGGGEARGAAAAATFRGLPVELTGRLFAAEASPSEQDDAAHLDPEAGSGALDVARRGVALDGRWRRRLVAGLVEIGAGATVGEVEPTAPLGGGRALETGWTRIDGRLVLTPSRDRWRGLLDLAAGLERGRTDGDGWSRHHLELAAGLGRRGGRGGGILGASDRGLRIAWSRRGSEDVTHGFDRYRLGGAPRSILPEAADPARLSAPALGAGTLVGDEHEGQRLEVATGLLPAGATLTYERHRAWNDGEPAGAWLAVAGVEIGADLPPMPILGLPAARLTAGAAYVLDAPFEGETRLWAAVAWHP